MAKERSTWNYIENAVGEKVAGMENDACEFGAVSNGIKKNGVGEFRQIIILFIIWIPSHIAEKGEMSVV